MNPSPLQYPIVGIAGGIGSGKSVVSRILRLRGYDVYDCDSRARSLMESRLLSVRLRDILGDAAFLPDGSLDRTYVAQCIFTDSGMRASVNALVHQAVRDDVVACASSSPSSVFFVESAILASSGLCRLCREIWLVEAPEDLRMQRVARRNPGLNAAQIAARMEAQRGEDLEVRRFSPQIIVNAPGSLLLPRIDALLDHLKENIIQ